MLIIKSYFHNNIIKYGIVLGLLFFTILFLINFSFTIDYQIDLKKNSEFYRTVRFSFKDDYNLEMINLNEYEIEDIINEMSSDEIDIIFKNYNDAMRFKDNNKDLFKTVYISNFDMNNNYKVTKNVTNGLIIICLLIILILIFLFSINIIYNIEKDISLYKLLGFNDKYIILITLFFIILYYLLLYVISILIYFIFSKILILKEMVIIKDIKFMNLLSYRYLLYVWIFISVITFLSFIRIIYKIKKNSPINLVNFN